MKRAALSCILSLLALGCGENPQAPSESEAKPSQALSSQPLSFIQVSAGTFHTCGVTRDNLAYCWGGDDKGQLGNGTSPINVSFTAPVAVVGGHHFRHVTSGYEHSCGLTIEGKIYCWGMNFFGQLGNGKSGETQNVNSTPMLVAGNRTYRMVRAGYSHTCAITSSNAAFCWGENIYGQVGDGTTTWRSVPTQVLGNLRWMQLSGGGEHTCGVTQSDQLYCWGLNGDGQLGNGGTSNRLKPFAVSGGRQFRQVDAGGNHTCAVTTTDVAYCWGLNFNGALGDGSTAGHLTPSAVAGLRRFDHVNAGDLHTCGITLNGRGFCWGRNDPGQLGDGTGSNRLKPVQFGSSVVWRQVSAGLFHSCAVAANDRAYCWGSGGLLGDGTISRSFLPIPVVGPS